MKFYCIIAYIALLKVLCSTGSEIDRSLRQDIDDVSWSFSDRQLMSMSNSGKNGKPAVEGECKFKRPEETTEECNQGRKSEHDLPFCVGIRGNGPSLWAHFTALARAVEAFGPVSGVAGGSSGTAVAFIFESIQSNPLILNCGESGCCSGMEQRARISFLLKSVQAVPSESIISPDVALASILQQIQERDILPRLRSNDNTLQDAALQDLLDILNTERQNRS